VFAVVYIYVSHVAEDTPKPTVALEYTFGRRSTSTTQKDIAHIWELGKWTATTTVRKCPLTFAVASYSGWNEGEPAAGSANYTRTLALCRCFNCD
jgi:hypothetical protein